MAPNTRDRLNLLLSDPEDDENEAHIAATFEQLVNADIDPASAAFIVDETVSRDCQDVLASYKEKKSPPYPSPSGWQKFVYDCIASAAMRVPASHHGQESLVRFVDELKRLPRHKVPAVYQDPERLTEKELWVLTRRNGYDYFEQWLWECQQGMLSFVGTDHILDASINFSAFLARLLGQGVAAILSICPVFPFAKRNISNLRDTEIKTFERTIAAAAQWVLYAGPVLLEMCRRKVLAGLRWKPALWDNIQRKFGTLVHDKRFTEIVRDYAKKSADWMLELEILSLSTDPQIEQIRIVDAYEFLDIISADDDDEDDS